MLVYLERNTPRATYIFNVMLGDMMGLEVQFTTEKEAFTAHSGPKLSYCPSTLDSELHFYSQGLLNQTGIEDQHIAVQDSAHGKVFFCKPKNAAVSAMNFDVFAASFFLLSRYEECLPHIRDMYDRFEAKESIAYKHGFLTEPVVDQWLLQLTQILLERYPGLPVKERRYTYLPTIDIDNAYAYRNKGLIRTLGAFARDLVNRDLRQLSDRFCVLAGRRKDPYDTYGFQFEMQQEFDQRTVYFLLMADYGTNDKSVPHHNRQFRSLIKHLADYAAIGIHPGFNSNLDAEKIKTEKKRLEQIIHRPVAKSRQHFLILHLPYTYQKLIQNDIKEDYSMGYASHTGFRAGTCTPFRYYDLGSETPTNLTVFPFAMMEATLKYYMKLNPEESKLHIAEIIEKVKNVKGTFISLWHNETLSDEGVWKGWRSVYRQMTQQAQP